MWAAGGTNLRKPRSEARATREHLDGEAPIQPGGSNGPRHAPAGPPPRYSGSGDDLSTAVGRGRRPGWRPPDNHLQPPGFDRAEDVGTSRTVFALGGAEIWGGSGGHAHGLLEAGVVPDAVVGTSVGALNGAFLAGRPDLSAIEPLRELWASISRRDIFPMSVAGVVAALLGRRSSLFESLGLRSLILNARLGFSNLEHATIPLHVVATDIERAEVVVLSRGPALAALLASTAIPGILPPVDIGGRALVDGGVLANVPLLEADALGAWRSARGCRSR